MSQHLTSDLSGRRHEFKQAYEAFLALGLAASAGVKLTAAGAPFPYGKDPRDRNIRIAPTFPPLEDIEKATRVLTACVKLAASKSRD